ncbi:uncharacterized protein LOC133778600 isoform X2 [Humulus lupulus]|nr:uncharacterized protein LOC133778600 isoform X2 [Humulus lupulus]
MLNTLVGFFNKISLEEMLSLDHKKPTNHTKEIIYRDELSKKKNKKPKNGISNSYYSSLEIKEPLIKKNPSKETICTTITTTKSQVCSEEENKGVVRVKVTMTKQEAARLLSKCKEGGKLEFKDVAQELEKIPVNRVSVDLSPLPTSSYGGRKVLQSIPEE